MNVFEDIFRDLAGAFKEIFNCIENLVLNVFDVLREVKYEEKVKFKPILEIRPNKINYPNKRLLNYYCRNNC